MRIAHAIEHRTVGEAGSGAGRPSWRGGFVIGAF
jgi:hypothetical protein